MNRIQTTCHSAAQSPNRTRLDVHLLSRFRFVSRRSHGQLRSGSVVFRVVFMVVVTVRVQVRVQLWFRKLGILRLFFASLHRPLAHLFQTPPAFINLGLVLSLPFRTITPSLSLPSPLSSSVPSPITSLFTMTPSGKVLVPSTPSSSGEEESHSQDFLQPVSLSLLFLAHFTQTESSLGTRTRRIRRNWT